MQRLNVRTYAALAELQARLVQALSDIDFAPVPPSSFHITIADQIAGSDMQQMNIRTTAANGSDEPLSQETRELLLAMHSLDRDRTSAEIASPQAPTDLACVG